MIFKKILITLSFLFVNVISFSQQMGSGFASQINDFNIELPSGFYQGENAAGQVGGGGWNHLLNLRHNNTANNHQLQIASSYTENDKLFFRKFARGLGSNNPVWYEIATRGGNTFNGNQSVNGRLYVSTSSSEGGSLSLLNPSKSGVNAANEWVLFNMTGAYTNSLQFWSYGDNGYQSGAKLTLSDNGNVGIGTATPVSKLDIRGVISTPEIAFRNIDGGDDSDPYRLRKVQGASNNNWLELQLNDDPNESFRIYGNSCIGFGCGEYSGNLYHSFDAQGNVFHMGNVGIGTTTPDQKLTVNGTIHSKEIIVDTNITPDYVFQKYYTGKSELKEDYVIPTLAEIESFTKKNNHLPGVPSAKEMKEKGISLGEMSNILLQKIEELTLYTIEQQKELERLKAENKSYKSLAERLSAIENELKK